MAEKRNASVLAIVEESTPGTLAFPSAATDYIALQPDYDFEPNTEIQQNEELRNSIGRSKPILGNQNPKASFSHYFRHSGVEGQKPNYSKLMKSLFGAEYVASTEYDTVASSTTKVVKVDTGEGANFRRGQLLLPKDSVNGYHPRPILSVSGDDLTLAFALPGAPALGVNLGKSITWEAANSGHSKLSLHLYEGNGGAYVAEAGVQVQEAAFSIQAGQLINIGFSGEGTSYLFNPVRIQAADTKFDFTDGAGAKVGTIVAKVYNNPNELAAAIEAALNAAGSSDTFTCVYNNRGANAGKYTLTSDGSTFSINAASGSPNFANSGWDKIGFAASNLTGSLTYTSATAASWAAPHTPSYDDADPNVAKSAEVYLGNQDDAVCIGLRQFDMTVSLGIQQVPDLCEDSGISEKSVNERDASCNFVAKLSRHDADLFDRYINGTETGFFFCAGKKSGGNFIPGTVVYLYIPTATLSAFKTADADGNIVIEGTATAFVNSDGEPEVYAGCA